MTEVAEPDLQELDRQLDALKTLIGRFEQFPKEVRALTEGANRDPAAQEAGAALQKVWEGGLRDSVKKMISYTQQVVGLHEEFQGVLQAVQSSSDSDAPALPEQVELFAPNADRALGETATEQTRDTIQLQETDAAAPVSKRKKTKHFV